MALNKRIDYYPYLFTCNRCKSCTISDDEYLLPLCPAYQYYGFFSHCAGGKIYISAGIIEKKIKPDRQISKVVYQCMMCAACEKTCPGKRETIMMFRDLREEMLRKNLIPPALKTLLTKILENKNPWKRGEVEDSLLKQKRDNAPILFYPGCKAISTPLQIQKTYNVMRIIKMANINLFTLDAPICCGEWALQLGDKKTFKKIALQNIKLLNKLNIKKLVTLCPHCYTAFKGDYQDEGDLNFEVMHLVEFLSEIISDFNLSINPECKSKTIVFHDPCYLARYNDLTEYPRKIISFLSDLNFKELSRTKENTFCCGAGGGVREAFPEFSLITAQSRLEEAKDAKAEIIVTSCPYCQEQLNDAANQFNYNIKVYDLTDLLEVRNGIGSL